MSPYRGSPTTDTNDAIRLLIGDTSTSTGNEIFADGEIDYFAALKPNAHLAAAAAVTSIQGTARGNTLAGAISKSVGDLSIDYGNASVSEVLTAKVNQLRADGSRGAKPFAGGVSDDRKRDTERDTDWTERMRVAEFDDAGAPGTTHR